MAEEQGQKPDFLAGDRIVGDYAPFQLFAGEAEVVTDKAPVAEAVLQYQVISLDTDGAIVPYTAAEGQVAIGIACNPASAGTSVAYYVGGFFNHLALEWPAGVTTLAARKAVFARTPIRIGHLPPVAPTP